jgi:hypothetical protein
LDPIGFCPLLGKYGPGVGTRNKNDTSYMYWFMSGSKPILTIFQLYLGIEFHVWNLNTPHYKK